MCMFNDPVKLVFGCDLGDAAIDRLDLTLLQEIKRSKDGAVEVKLVDKVKLAEMSGELGRGGSEAFDRLLAALDEVGKAMK